jgi:hypothetical protein
VLVAHGGGEGGTAALAGGAGREGAVALALFGSHLGQAADASARAVRLRPRAGLRRGQRCLPVAVAGKGQQHSLCLAHVGVKR